MKLQRSGLNKLMYVLAIAAVALAAAIVAQVWGLYSLQHAYNISEEPCHVYRPYGPGTTNGITIEGACGIAAPLYVASFNSLEESHISTPYMTVNMPSITVGAWFYLPNLSYQDNPRFVANGHTDVGGNRRGAYEGFQLSEGIGAYIGHFDVGNGTAKGSVFWWLNLSPSTWYYYVGTYNGSTGAVHAYINGKLEGNGTFSGRVWSRLPVAIGYDPAYNMDFVNGLMANVQVYNASLSIEGIQALYNEGIGGAPIGLENLTAWWPLDGNANDYSGNGYNGTAANVVFTSDWTT